MSPRSESEVYDFDATLADGQVFPLASLRGQVVLIVNTASQCGFTAQYEDLQRLYSSFHSRGFTVLGFPCNQFGAQEPGSEAEICAFTQSRFGVSFPLFSKVDVNGPHTHPLFRFLKRARPGVFQTTSVKWNFTKFLVDRQGRVVRRYAPAKRPESLVPAIERLLRGAEKAI